MRGRKSLGCPTLRSVRVGATCEANKPVGRNVKGLQLQKSPPSEIAVMGYAKRRPGVYSGKANVPGEETGDSTLGAAGVGVPARREGRQRQRWEEPLRSRGLAATCKDLSYKG